MDAVVVRDPADRWVLANARKATADILVTGDSDLLAVGSVAGLRIVTPREFWTELRRGDR